MTQLTEYKQHYIHNTAGQFSMSTHMGRTEGGRIRVGEMDRGGM